MEIQQPNDNERGRPSPDGTDEPEVQTPISPRIYVASLSDYNNGILHGEWIDADSDPEELNSAIQAMLDRSPTGQAEEFAILDFEGFGPWRLGEYESIAMVTAVAQGMAEHGPAFAHWVGSLKPRNPTPCLASRTPTSAIGTAVEEYAEELLDRVRNDELTIWCRRPTPAMSGSTTRDSPGTWSFAATSKPVKETAVSTSSRATGDRSSRRCGMVNEGVRLRILPGRMEIQVRKGPMDEPRPKPSGPCSDSVDMPSGSASMPSRTPPVSPAPPSLGSRPARSRRPAPTSWPRSPEALGLSAGELFARAGYLVANDLPEYATYLRTKHPELPMSAIQRLQDLLAEMLELHQPSLSLVPAIEESTDERSGASQ